MTVEVSESMVAKAVQLIEERRVDVTGPDNAFVRGFSGDYRVYADETGLECTCPARKGCSHIIAAMLMFRLRDMKLEAEDAEPGEGAA